MRRRLKFRVTAIALFILCAFILNPACVKRGPMDTTGEPEAVAPQPFTAPFVGYLLFGYWEGEPFTSDWVETRNIPHDAGLKFGWRIKLQEPHGRYVTIIERMTAPHPLPNWGRLDERHLVRSDRCVATVPNSLKVRDGWIHRSNWAVSADDPLGRYQLEVQVNGRMATRVFFTLEPPVAKDAGKPPEEIAD